MRHTLLLGTLAAVLSAGSPLLGESPRRYGVAQVAGEYVVNSQIVSDTVIGGSGGYSGSSEGYQDASCGCEANGCDGQCGGTCGGSAKGGKAQAALASVADCLANGSMTPGGMHPDRHDPNSVVTPNGGPAIGRQFSRPDLFYNFYTQGQANQINAQMYIAPVPVPPWVGNTFYTYQPFMPHEFLYSHNDRYHHIYDNGRGLNRTSITYVPGAKQVIRDMYFNFRIPR
jgi:hypothetical protein